MLNSEEVKKLFSDYDEVIEKVVEYLTLYDGNTFFKEEIGLIAGSCTTTGFSVGYYYTTESWDTETYIIPWRVIDDFGGIINELKKEKDARKKIAEDIKYKQEKEMYERLKAQFET